jgi:hypothetical protein
MRLPGLTFSIAALAVWLAAGAPSVAAQNDTAPAHPNFSGRWRMVKDKSDFPRATMPDMVVRFIEQRDSTMNIHTVQTNGAVTKSADVSYFLDGSPSTNILHNHEATSKTFWDGPALNIRTILKLSNGEEEVVEDRYELSDDGNTLTTTSHISTSKGGTILKLVCEKEKTQ